MKKPPRPSALLFDLDGTLVDSRRDIAEALNVALVAVDRACLPLEAIVPMIGDGARMLVARALGIDVDPSKEDRVLLDRAAALFFDAYLRHPCVHTTLMAGARDAIAVDVPRGLLTNKPRAIACLVLEHLGIASSFGAVYAGGDGPLKPAPDGVRALTASLGEVQVERVWLIGDGPQDVLAGRAAGCFTIAVPGIGDPAQVIGAKPDLVLPSLVDVAHLAADALGDEHRVTSA